MRRINKAAGLRAALTYRACHVRSAGPVREARDGVPRRLEAGPAALEAPYEPGSHGPVGTTGWACRPAGTTLAAGASTQSATSMCRHGGKAPPGLPARGVGPNADVALGEGSGLRAGLDGGLPPRPQLAVGLVARLGRASTAGRSWRGPIPPWLCSRPCVGQTTARPMAPRQSPTATRTGRE